MKLFFHLIEIVDNISNQTNPYIVLITEDHAVRNYATLTRTMSYVTHERALEAP